MKNPPTDAQVTEEVINYLLDGLLDHCDCGNLPLDKGDVRHIIAAYSASQGQKQIIEQMADSATKALQSKLDSVQGSYHLDKMCFEEKIQSLEATIGRQALALKRIEDAYSMRCADVWLKHNMLAYDYLCKEISEALYPVECICGEINARNCPIHQEAR